MDQDNTIQQRDQIHQFPQCSPQFIKLPVQSINHRTKGEYKKKHNLRCLELEFKNSTKMPVSSTQNWRQLNQVCATKLG